MSDKYYHPPGGYYQPQPPVGTGRHPGMGYPDNDGLTNSSYHMANVNCHGNPHYNNRPTNNHVGDDDDYYDDDDGQNPVGEDNMMMPAQGRSGVQHTHSKFVEIDDKKTRATVTETVIKPKKSDKHLRHVEFTAVCKIPSSAELMNPNAVDMFEIDNSNGGIVASLRLGNLNLSTASHRGEIARVLSDEVPTNVFPAILKVKEYHNGTHAPVRLEFTGISLGLTAKDDDHYWPNSYASQTVLPKSKGTKKTTLLKRAPEHSVAEFLRVHGTADPSILEKHAVADPKAPIVRITRYETTDGGENKPIPEADLIAELYDIYIKKPLTATEHSIEIPKHEFNELVDKFRKDLSEKQRVFNLNDLQIKFVPINNPVVEGTEGLDRVKALWHYGDIVHPTGNDKPGYITVHGELVYLSTTAS